MLSSVTSGQGGAVGKQLFSNQVRVNPLENRQGHVNPRQHSGGLGSDHARSLDLRWNQRLSRGVVKSLVFREGGVDQTMYFRRQLTHVETSWLTSITCLSQSVLVSGKSSLKWEPRLS